MAIANHPERFDADSRGEDSVSYSIWYYWAFLKQNVVQRLQKRFRTKVGLSMECETSGHSGDVTRTGEGRLLLDAGWSAESLPQSLPAWNKSTTPRKISCPGLDVNTYFGKSREIDIP